MAKWPMGELFYARDKQTGLVHTARDYDAMSYTDSIIEWATWCGITLSHRDFEQVDHHPTCLECATEAVLRPFTVGESVGMAVINVAAIKKLDFHLTNPCGEVVVGTAETGGRAGDIISVKVDGNSSS